MRKAFCDAMVARSHSGQLVFMTGDLGFMALEPLQIALGERFINAGVAEQNMISVAAALSHSGLETWTYSIAPFCTARPFEQIRNDVALHSLPVKIVGNGGGYGYGVMGPTHHAIEDYGTLLALHGVRACIPAFDEDVQEAVALVGNMSTPCYLRLGRGEPPTGFTPPPFEPWRQLVDGAGPVIVAVGPIAGTLIGPLLRQPVALRPSLWTVGMLPVMRYLPPAAIEQAIATAGALLIVEEHVARGSFASEYLLYLAERGQIPRRFKSLHAQAPQFKHYGSQRWLRQQSGLDPDAILAAASAL